MPNAKLELDPSEENEIGFQLKIEGTDKDLASSKPKIRFAITENKTNRGWIFAAEKTDDGIAVTIPQMKDFVSEGEEYSGKLEVILGGRYFTPTEVDINFVEPLKVEAAIVNKKTVGSETLKEEAEVAAAEPELSVESSMAGITVRTKPARTIKEDKVAPPPAKPKHSKYSYSHLTEDVKTQINKNFVRRCHKLDPESFSNLKEISSFMKEGTDKTKRKLKLLLQKATKEVVDSNS